MSWPSNGSMSICTVSLPTCFFKNDGVKIHGVFPPIAGVFTLKSRKFTVTFFNRHGRHLYMPYNSFKSNVLYKRALPQNLHVTKSFVQHSCPALWWPETRLFPNVDQDIVQLCLATSLRIQNSKQNILTQTDTHKARLKPRPQHLPTSQWPPHLSNLFPGSQEVHSAKQRKTKPASSMPETVPNPSSAEELAHELRMGSSAVPPRLPKTHEKNMVHKVWFKQLQNTSYTDMCLPVLLRHFNFQLRNVSSKALMVGPELAPAGVHHVKIQLSSLQNFLAVKKTHMQTGHCEAFKASAFPVQLQVPSSFLTRFTKSPDSWIILSLLKCPAAVARRCNSMASFP